jgi:hypothetical protein
MGTKDGKNNRYFLGGIVSTGLHCAEYNVPGVSVSTICVKISKQSHAEGVEPDFQTVHLPHVIPV